MEPFTFDPLHKNLKSHAASGFVFSGLAQATKLLTQFISVVVMARLLDPADFGLVAMVSPVYAFAVLFHDLGLSQATMQKHQLSSAQVNTFFWINVSLGTIICMGLFIVSPFVGLFYGDSRTVALTMAMAVLVFIGGFGNQHGAIMVRRMQFRAQSITNIVASVLGLLGAVIWGYFYGGYWSLYVGMALSTCTAVVGVWLCVPWRPKFPELAPETLEMLKFGLGVTSANLTNFAVQSTSNIVVGRVLGDRPLGLYDRSSRLLSSPLQQLIYPISGVVVPILYRLHDDKERYNQTFLRTLGLITLIIFPGVIWAITFADLLVVRLLGNKWNEAAPIFTALSVAAMPQLINSAANWLFITQGRSVELMRWNFFNGAVSLSALLIGLHYGIVGVAIAAVIAQCFCSPILWWYVCRKGSVHFKEVFETLLPQLIGGAIAFGLLKVMRHFIIGFEWPTLIGSGIMSYVITCMIVIMFSTGRKAIIRDLRFANFLLNQLLNKIRPKLNQTDRE